MWAVFNETEEEKTDRTGGTLASGVDWQIGAKECEDLMPVKYQLVKSYLMA